MNRSSQLLMGDACRLCGWLLAAPVLVLYVAGVVHFAASVVAEQRLAAALRAGAEESLRPRATGQSVTQAVHRLLDDAEFASRLDPVQVTVDLCGVTGEVRARRGAEVRVSTALNMRAAGWDVLAALGLAGESEKLHATYTVFAP
ncbi:MAG: hypothetical protein WDZ59_02250 [Pirellulales bacterium]